VTVLVLGHDDVRAALAPGACAAAMREALAAHARGEAFQPLRTVVRPPGAAGLIGLMPAWRDGPDPAFGVKTLVIVPGNPARGLDAHQGTVTLFDGGTGQPVAILDASALTEIRTAAVSAVATAALARPGAQVLAVLGAGVQGRAHVEALRGVAPEVRVFAPTRAHAEALGVTVCSSAEQAVRGADIVVLATSSREPVLRFEWLSPGAHVNAVGASTPDGRELDTATVAGAALFVDSRESLRAEAGEWIEALRTGAVAGEDHVRATLGEVLAGQAPGRRDAQEVTVFRSLGLAIEDLAAASLAVQTARAAGIGTEVAW
jgi:ornithine cyclodeaminase/alanine dehydrogenase-like protein (mu-crystallin family)